MPGTALSQPTGATSRQSLPLPASRSGSGAHRLPPPALPAVRQLSEKPVHPCWTPGGMPGPGLRLGVSMGTNNFISEGSALL